MTHFRVGLQRHARNPVRPRRVMYLTKYTYTQITEAGLPGAKLIKRFLFRPPPARQLTICSRITWWENTLGKVGHVWVPRGKVGTW